MRSALELGAIPGEKATDPAALAEPSLVWHDVAAAAAPSSLPAAATVMSIPHTLDSCAIQKLCAALEQHAGSEVIFAGGSRSDFVDTSLQHSMWDLHRTMQRLSAVHSICRGDTRDDGMIFLCSSRYVLAHTDATFGFSGVRRGAAAGVAIALAAGRMNTAACERLVATGDIVDAGAAARLGLVDFIGTEQDLQSESRYLSQCGVLRPDSGVTSARAPPVWPLLSLASKHAAPFASGHVAFKVGFDPSKCVAVLNDVSGQALLSAVPLAAVKRVQQDGVVRVLVLNGLTEYNEQVDAEQAAAVLDSIFQLQAEGILIICVLRTRTSGLGALVFSAADYRLVEYDTQLVFDLPGANSVVDSFLSYQFGVEASCHLQTAALKPHEAEQHGVVDAIGDRSVSASQRALQFASWLTSQKPSGLAHTLPQLQSRLYSEAMRNTTFSDTCCRAQLRPKLQVALTGIQSQRRGGQPAPSAVADPARALKAVMYSIERRPTKRSVQLPEARPPAEATLTPLAARFTELLTTEMAGATPKDIFFRARADVADGNQRTGVDVNKLSFVATYKRQRVDNAAHPPVILLRHAKVASSIQPPLVISHSLLGDHRGYGGLWSQKFERSDIYALRHRGLSGVQPYALDQKGGAAMVKEYAAALLEQFGSKPFDLIGASFGAVLAAHVANASRAVGANPRRVVLVDPPPALSTTLPIPSAISSMRTAAMGVLLIMKGVEMGANVWKQYPQLQSLPEEVLAAFIACQCMNKDSAWDTLEEEFDRYELMLPVYRQCRYSFHTLSASITPFASFEDAKQIQVLKAISTGRWPTFKEMFPGVKDDDLNQYGPAATLLLPGMHLEMVARCISNRDPDFTGTVERFLGESFADVSWFAARHVEFPNPHKATVQATPALPTDPKALVALLSKHFAAPVPVASAVVSCAAPSIEVAAVIRTLSQEVLGSQVSADSPLMESGLDSLGAVEFRNQLSEELGGIELPETLVFDFPTLRQVEAFVGEQHRNQTSSLKVTADDNDATSPLLELAPELTELLRGLGSIPTSTEKCNGALLDRIALAAAACALPGGVHGVGATAKANLVGLDTFEQVPQSRWDFEAISAGMEPSIASRTRYGGFLASAHLFDNTFFFVSRSEAIAMDPQQRLVLETGYQAFHGSHLHRAALVGSVTGVHVGIFTGDFTMMLDKSPAGSSVYSATGSSHAVASGRVSYILGLQGPCVSYDTSCSSALTACHAARRGLQLDECPDTLAEGVNMMLTPAGTTSFAIAGMTSILGRSHTWDIRADGYGRAEASCATVLRQSFNATSIAVSGSALRQDGRSASLTAPNGQAQQHVIEVSMADAGVTPNSLALHEAHGTGTALGDPIETGSLSAVTLARRGQEGYGALPMAGLKANVGHGEATAGISGLLRLALGMGSSQVGPNAQLRQLNPHLANSLRRGSSCALPVQPSYLDSHADAGGVSSFGYNGAIVHTALHRAPLEELISFSAPRHDMHFRHWSFPWFGFMLPSTVRHLQQVNASAKRPQVAETFMAEWLYAVVSTKENRAAGGQRVLVVGQVPPGQLLSTFAASMRTTVMVNGESVNMRTLEQHDIVVLALGLVGVHAHFLEDAFVLASAQQLLKTLRNAFSVPLWICTPFVQPVTAASLLQPAHSGLWGFARKTRFEMPMYPVVCLDVHSALEQVGASSSALRQLLSQGYLQVEDGNVFGLTVSPSSEPDAALRGGSVFVPRIAYPASSALSMVHFIKLEDVRAFVKEHLESAVAAIDWPALFPAYDLLDRLATQYINGSVNAITVDDVPVWHHKLLYAWAADWMRRHTFRATIEAGRDLVSPADCINAHLALNAEVPLTQACGEALTDVLLSKEAYQQVLFPGGSMERVRPMYEDAVPTNFYNKCLVASVLAIGDTTTKKLCYLEVGSGTGGTASFLLPVVKESIWRYVYTDVSTVFLRQAAVRFRDYAHLLYFHMLNIDADPRLQGFASHQADVVVGTNVLHATPNIRKTMTNCRQLLADGGFILINEMFRPTASVIQITFGMTDGWWLFAEVSDTERTGQDSPLLSWRQWEALLLEVGWERVMPVTVNAAAVGGPKDLSMSQAIIVAQAFGSGQYDIATSTVERKLDLLATSGSMGRLGLLVCRWLLDESTSEKFVILNSSDQDRSMDWSVLNRQSRTVELATCSAADAAAFVATLCSSFNALRLSSTRLKHVVHMAHLATEEPVAGNASLVLHKALNSLVSNTAMALTSPAAVFGATPASSASAQVDSYAALGRRAGLPSISLSLDLLNVDEKNADLSMGPSLGSWLRAAAGVPALMVLTAGEGVIVNSGASMVGLLTEFLHAAPCRPSLTSASAAASAFANNCRAITVSINMLIDVIDEVAGIKVDQDAPLMESGVDSLAAVELRNKLQTTIGEADTLPSTLLLDYPTARALQHVMQAQAENEEVLSPLQARLGGSDDRAISIRAVSTMLPKNIDSATGIWALASAGMDTADVVPLERWDVTMYPVSEGSPDSAR